MGLCPALLRPAEYFEDRREYFPVGFARNVMLLTILEILRRPKQRRYVVPPVSGCVWESGDA